VGRDGQDRVRDPRLTLASAGYPPLVAVAHGSKDPRAAATVSELLGVVSSRAADAYGGGVDVRAAFLDHCAPSLPQVLGALGGEGTPLDGGRMRSCIVVPLLLTAAYHSKSDIPAQLAAASRATHRGVAKGGAADGGAADGDPDLDVRCADTLGPHPLLLTALERRLREVGVATTSAADRARTAVVLAAAGSSDPAANATIADLADRWRRDRGWRAVVPAYASAAGPSPAEAVAALRAGRPGPDGAAAAGAAHGPVVVATYLLAPGYFADKIRAGALEAGAAAVSAVLGPAPEVADVVLARYRAALAEDGADARLCDRLWPDSGYSDRAVATRGLRPVSKVLHTGKPTWNGCYGACAAPRITLRGRLMRPERADGPREEGNAHLARRRVSPRGYVGRVG
jgi:sirohydrochlorin ferrochelatase